MDSNGGWCVLQVRSGTESKVCDLIRSRCAGVVVDVFSPALAKLDTPSSKRFLPGYVFVKVAPGSTFLNEVSTMRGLYGIPCKFLNQAGSPKFLTDHDIDEMREFMTSAEFVSEGDKIVVGSRVAILCEYFESCVGEVDEIDEKHSKAKVRIVFCGQDVVVSFSLDQLKLVD
ncbi:transcription termination factor nusG family protein [Neorickettsia helminthoeca str. Oregon]|uniref:Transcription termination factor nusG family protein n=1 Tax=Neorickettsia helminthoeca str. Oregon TaxID=1286528 RepID=X5H4U2_9RICK|nr:transcription termination/antitermination NusG family protein [Neorickettsia helminthoeca]AHX11581.1 transcription termination factor nusG family protein [Neorickettsia helminthoeca str. Oregon]